MAKIEINLSTACRACLEQQEEMHDLFKYLEKNLNLADILERTTYIKVSSGDGLSQYLCKRCAAIVVDFYNFKRVFQENEEQVQSFFKSNNKFKNNENTQGYDIEETDIKIEFKEEPIDHITDPEALVLTDDENSRNDNLMINNELVQIKEVIKYICQKCSSSYSKKSRFTSHMLEKHNESIKDYKEYSIKVFIAQPIEEGKNNATNCLKCNIEFETLEELNLHTKTHRSFICEECGAAFNRKSILSDHMQKHTTVCRYICPFCGKGFRHRGPFSKHRKIHTDPGHAVCDTCGRRFNDTTTLKTHIQLIHIKSRNYLCTTCGLSFPLPATLRKHNLRKHAEKSRENSFKCQFCHMAYKDKSSLGRHIVIKHDDSAIKPSCTLCNKVYTTTTNLSKHMRRHHSGKSKAVQSAAGQIEDTLIDNTNIKDKVVTEQLTND